MKTLGVHCAASHFIDRDIRAVTRSGISTASFIRAVRLIDGNYTILKTSRRSFSGKPQIPLSGIRAAADRIISRQIGEERNRIVDASRSGWISSAVSDVNL